MVDEAHLIYVWGLIASGKSRYLATHSNCQDRGVFRPSYGNLCSQFLATDHAPVLLMSATCRPQALRAIRANLRWKVDDVVILQGELVRPEIRLIRVNLKHTLKSAQDIQQFFGLSSNVLTKDIPPTLIYSNTQDGTLECMRAVNIAHGRPQDSQDGRAKCARRFSSVTGPMDKIERCGDFVSGKFVVMCCTTALGLGQNWTMTRRVIVLGRGDPAAISQMLGRCGRDRRPGLGILMVESTRALGSKSKIPLGDINNCFSEYRRKKDLAETPLCLRIVMAVDNL